MSFSRGIAGKLTVGDQTPAVVSVGPDRQTGGAVEVLTVAPAFGFVGEDVGCDVVGFTHRAEGHVVPAGEIPTRD